MFDHTKKVFMLRSPAKCLLVLTTVIASGLASAATLFETTQQVASTAAADARLPQPLDVQIATEGSYTITLTDLQTPQALGSLRAIVVRDLQVVATAAVVYPTGSTPPAPATASFSATPGTYRIHVLPIAAANAPGGGYGISVAPTAGGPAIASDADVVAAATEPDSGQSVLHASFDIAAAGTYQLAIDDRAFPAAMSSTQVLLMRQTSSAPVIVSTAPGTFVAAAGTYDMFVIATADVATRAGLYTVSVSGGPAASDVYRSTQPVGVLPPPTSISIATAGEHALAIADAQFPAALGNLGAAVVQSHSLLGSVVGTGATTVVATTGTAQLYSFGIAGSAGTGAYTRRLEQGTQLILSDTQIVDASSDPATPAIFAFSTSTPVAGGSYRLRLEDFAFPLAFSSLRAVVAQGSTFSTVLEGEGDLSVTLPSGHAKVLVAATPPAATGNALFGITLTLPSSGNVALESTQGVGGLFRSDTVAIPTSGPYDITLADLQFPASLQTAVLAMTRGTTLVAQVVGGGTVPRQQLSPGTYVLNFLGRPATSAAFGAYGMKVADSPAAPTVTLSAVSASITSGQSAMLQWTVANATTCAAANGWSGNKSASGGTETVGPLTANTTFELTCSGPGGSASASAAVSVTAPQPARRRGGGGAMDLALLLLLASGAAFVRGNRR